MTVASEFVSDELISFSTTLGSFQPVDGATTMTTG